MSPTLRAAAVAIFAATYIVIALGRLPGFRLDRAGAAVVGASLMLAAGVLDFDAVTRAIDLATLALLLGLMLLVGGLRLSGFFRLVSAVVIGRARHPLVLLAAIVLTSGVFSAFLLNDAICLVMTPVVLDITARLRRDPVPYLLAVAAAANAGSAATITGNPQNILIAGFSHISYAGFAAALAPVAAVGLVLTYALIVLLHPREFRAAAPLRTAVPPVHLHAPLAWKSVGVTVATMAAFFAGQPPAKVALVAGGALLLTRRIRNERLYREVDWPLLLMFSGLFVVVAGFEKAALTPDIVTWIDRLGLGDTAVLAAAATVLSNLVSNVPAVLVLKPLIGTGPGAQHSWLVVAMASTLAGNFLILGSVANLIVVQGARAKGVTIGFWAHFRVGAPLSVLTILIGVWWLWRP